MLEGYEVGGVEEAEVRFGGYVVWTESLVSKCEGGVVV